MKTLFLFLSILLCTASIFAQNTGTWTGSTAQTTTPQAVGIGTLSPRGYLEVEYCDDQQNGVVITKKECGQIIATPTGSFDPSYDGVNYPITGEPNPGPIAFVPPNLFLSRYASFMDKPLLWARIENPGTFVNPSGSHTSRLIVTPYGRTGINIENPRAALDVKSLGGYNTPAVIIGHQKPGTTNRTQHIHFVPLLNEDSYNKITKQDDQGFFFTDGAGSDGSNVNGSFIIAPWSLGNQAIGLRMDSKGNIGLGVKEPLARFHLANGDLLLSDNGIINIKLYKSGLIRAREILVDLDNIPDYVFHQDYKLLSLGELEKYIITNGHLPGIPSATEYKEAGAIDITALQMKLLEKIEELTLYMLQLKKKNELMEQELVLLKQLLNR